MRRTLSLLLLAGCGSSTTPSSADGGPRIDAGAPIDGRVFPDATSSTGATAAQTKAWQDVNALRAQAGVGPVNLSTELDNASQAHAEYYLQHPSLYSGPSAISAHQEDMNTTVGFTGVNFWDRDSQAGYTGSPMSEIMAFFGNPDLAMPLWMDSVLHRVPIIHPDAIDMGYGGDMVNGMSVDVIDFGGPETAGNTIVVWPPNGATGIHPQFAGNEFPTPPPPPSGSFPAGPIASVIFERLASVTITKHELRDGAGNLLPHTFIAPDDASLGPYLLNSCALYSDPGAAGATFHATVEGTVNGTAFSEDWSFTTQ